MDVSGPMRQLTEFPGRVALVTGASRGTAPKSRASWRLPAREDT